MYYTHYAIQQSIDLEKNRQEKREVKMLPYQESAISIAAADGLEVI